MALVALAAPGLQRALGRRVSQELMAAVVVVERALTSKTPLAALVARVAPAPSILFSQAGLPVQVAGAGAAVATPLRARATRMAVLVARADCMAVVAQAAGAPVAVAALTHLATAAMAQGAQLLYLMRTHQ